MKVSATVTWRCERGDVEVANTVEYGESAWPPSDFNWCSDEDGDHLFCAAHYKEWLADVRRKHPNTTWTA
jgi:hypothetical protein